MQCTTKHNNTKPVVSGESMWTAFTAAPSFAENPIADKASELAEELTEEGSGGDLRIMAPESPSVRRAVVSLVTPYVQYMSVSHLSVCSLRLWASSRQIRVLRPRQID